MALTVNDNFANGGMREIIRIALNGYGTNLRLSVMKGTMPGELATFDITSYTSDILATFNNAGSQLAITNDTINSLLKFTSGPGQTVAATATGTATWWVLYHETVVGPSIMGDVTDEVGVGTLKLDTVSVVSAATVLIQGFNVLFESAN